MNILIIYWMFAGHYTGENRFNVPNGLTCDEFAKNIRIVAKLDTLYYRCEVKK